MCNCSNTIDVRARCCPFSDSKGFKKCPANMNTAVFYLGNHLCCEIESAKTKRSAEAIMRNFLLRIIKLERWAATHVIYLYWKELAANQRPFLEEYPLLVELEELEEERKEIVSQRHQFSENYDSIICCRMGDNEEAYYVWYNRIRKSLNIIDPKFIKREQTFAEEYEITAKMKSVIKKIREIQNKYITKSFDINRIGKSTKIQIDFMGQGSNDGDTYRVIKATKTVLTVVSCGALYGLCEVRVTDRSSIKYIH